MGIVWRATSLFERVFSRLRLLSMVPPAHVALGVGHGDFVAVGEEFLGHFVTIGGLTPGESVLDVGCGTGRMAVPLTRYLSRGVRYRGFDVDRGAVARCRNRITPRFPNFRFEWADVYNTAYNPAGRTRACDYRFPYRDGAFDFVFLTSVFTHMLPRDVAHFLAEIARVLRPGGRCFATFFVLTPASEALIAAGRSSLDFRAEAEGCRVVNPDRPEDAIAYPEAWVRSATDAVGLRVRGPIRYGSWSGRADALGYQDMLVAVKE